MFINPGKATVYIASLVNGTVDEHDAQPLPGQKVEDSILNLTAWSPDGRALTGSIIRKSGRPAGVVVYDLSAKSFRIVSSDQTNWVRWLPDSRRVLYITLAGDLVVVDTASGTRTVVAAKLPASASDFSFALTPDGRTLFYGAGHAESDIWIAEKPKR